MTNQAFPARDGCLQVGDRCLRFVQLLTRDQFLYSQPPNDSIGAHLRHCLDFLTCFLEGIPRGEVNYDHRERDASLAQDPEKFQTALKSALKELADLEPWQSENSLTLVQIANSEGDLLECQTSVERELAFLTGHTVHHLAIAQLLAQLQGVQVTPDLTTAFSTEAYRKELAERATESVDV